MNDAIFLVLLATLIANPDATIIEREVKHKFTLGYLTGSARRSWDKEYSRPGLLISGEN